MKLPTKLLSTLPIVMFALFVLLSNFAYVQNVNAVYEEPSEGLWEVGARSNLPGESLGEFVGKIVLYALGVIGIILIILLLVGGFMYMTSQGNEEGIEKSKKLLTASIIGLIIVVVAYIISDYVISAVFAY